MIVQSVDIDTVERKTVELWWQKRGLQFTQSGYGSRIPSSTMVRWAGRWRRVYVCCWSNSGTSYIETKERDPVTGKRGWITFH